MPSLDKNYLIAILTCAGLLAFASFPGHVMCADSFLRDNAVSSAMNASSGSGLLMAQASPGDARKKDADSGEKQYRKVTAEGITFAWRVEGGNLSCIVSAPTDGWVSVGFDPTKMMKDANIIIGYVEDGVVHVEDHFGTANKRHRADTDIDGTRDILDQTGKETGDITEIAFTIPLNSGDEKDRILVPGKKYNVILAYGSRDNYKSKHREKAIVEIEL